jgi:hypothetical protein
MGQGDGHGNGEAYLASTSSGSAPTMTRRPAGTAAVGAIALSTHQESKGLAPGCRDRFFIASIDVAGPGS